MKYKRVVPLLLLCFIVLSGCSEGSSQTPSIIVPEITVPPINDSGSDLTPLTPTSAPAQSIDDHGVGYPDYVGMAELDDGNFPLLDLNGISFIVKEDHAELIFSTYIDDTLEQVIIPSAVFYKQKDYPVTSINAEAFWYFTELKEIHIPDTITSIGDSAFWGCEALKSIEIPPSVTKIDDKAFAHCEALENIVIPDSVTKIGTELFYNCLKLKKVKLPSGLKQIPDEMFSNCEALEELEIPESVTLIGNEAFWYCEALTELNIPNRVTAIGDRAFYDCISLTVLELPDELMSLGNEVFEYCDSLLTLKVPADQVDSYKEDLSAYNFEVVSK